MEMQTFIILDGLSKFILGKKEAKYKANHNEG